MALSYGYVYVAQVAMGSSHSQYFRAIKEAEAYPGPSLIICYSPCINHGIRGGMGKTQNQEKLAVECGYWHLYRYNPFLEAEGKNPFTLDSKEPDWSKFQDFIKSEIRYTSLKCSRKRQKPCSGSGENAKWRYNTYKINGNRFSKQCLFSLYKGRTILPFVLNKFTPIIVSDC